MAEETRSGAISERSVAPILILILILSRAASVFLEYCSIGPRARRLATIRFADSGAWSDSGDGFLSVVQCFQPAVINSR